MPYVLEARMVGHLRVHHGVVGLWCASLLAAFVSSLFLIVVVVAAPMFICEVLRSLVFVRAAILYPVSICSSNVFMSDVRS